MPESEPAAVVFKDFLLFQTEATVEFTLPMTKTASAQKFTTIRKLTKALVVPAFFEVNAVV